MSDVTFSATTKRLYEIASWLKGIVQSVVGHCMNYHVLGACSMVWNEVLFILILTLLLTMDVPMGIALTCFFVAGI